MRFHLSLAFLLVSGVTSAQTKSGQSRAPIIDIHVHAFGAEAMGRKPPIPTCAGELTFTPRDAAEPYSFEQYAKCREPLQSALNDSQLMNESIDYLKKYNVLAVVSGVRMSMVRQWRQTGGDRVIPAYGGGSAMVLDSLRRWVADGAIKMIGEITYQYEGLLPTDSVPERLFQLAEELDVPVGVHVGPGAPGAAYGSSPKYRMALSNPMLFEPMLVKHPKLRLCLMHAGWPFLSETVALLYAHPQVYVDVSLIDWYLPRAEFYAYLRRLIDAGFEKRIMFGSDQVVWPQVIPLAIDAINRAPFLSASQKRDILYNNAARFLRL